MYDREGQGSMAKRPEEGEGTFRKGAEGKNVGAERDAEAACVDRAMDKLRDEMAKTKSKAVGMVGEIVTLYLMADAENAAKILAEGKTLWGAYGAMKSVAQKERRECIDCEEAAQIFAEYYGFQKMPMEELWELAQGRKKAKPQAAAVMAPDVDDLDLDALLGL